MGAGFQGVCIALLLAKKYKNAQIDLIDKSTDIMNRASASQEGKIHLGFVYSNDATCETGKKILSDALIFDYMLEYLVDSKIDWDTIRSNNFMYIIPNDSLVSNKDIIQYFNKLKSEYSRLLESNKNNINLSYCGKQLNMMHEELDVSKLTYLNNTFIQGAHITEECAVKCQYIKNIIKNRLVVNKVNLILNTEIKSIQLVTDNKYVITTLDDKLEYNLENNLEYDMVVNCLWESRMKIDKCIFTNKHHDINNNIRIKCGIISKPIHSLSNCPSITIVNGPYGDYVNFNTDYMYFSWYPISMIKMFVNENINEQYDKLCSGEIDGNYKTELISKHETKFNDIFENTFTFIEPKLIAGAIVASGENDIQDTHSKLHIRHDDTIYTNNNGYYSISTGKFTSVPHNTYKLANLLGIADFIYNT